MTVRKLVALWSVSTARAARVCAIFWKGRCVFWSARLSCCPARCLCWDQRSCIRVAACARRSGRSLLAHARQAPLIRPCLRCSCSSDPTAFGVSRVSILRCCAKFAAALSSVIAGSAAISKVVAAAGERLDRRGAWTGLPPVSLLIPLKNIFDPKIPKERV